MLQLPQCHDSTPSRSAQCPQAYLAFTLMLAPSDATPESPQELLENWEEWETAGDYVSELMEQTEQALASDDIFAVGRKLNERRAFARTIMERLRLKKDTYSNAEGMSWMSNADAGWKENAYFLMKFAKNVSAGIGRHRTREDIQFLKEIQDFPF
jgi:hypothetical protein